MKLNNPFAQAIEEYLTGICTSNAVAEKILQEGKSLKGACDSIREVAKKNAVGGVGAVSDEDIGWPKNITESTGPKSMKR